MPNRDAMQAAIGFLKERLIDQDFSKLLQILRTGGADDEDESVTYGGLQQLNQARRETEPVLGGASDMALDSAAKVYRSALRTMGVQVAASLHDRASLRQMFLAHRDQRRSTGQSMVAMDAEAARGFAERHPHAAAIEVLI